MSALLPSPPTGMGLQPPFVSQTSLVDPNTFVQAMSFMATPAGQQSMTAFANHMANMQNPSQSPPQFSPPPHAGQKRKLNERHNNTQSQKSPQQSTKPPRAKAAVAPPIPSFGFTLPTTPSARPQTMSKGRGKKDQKNGKMQLGLTNQALLDESSEEEDVDEEAAYATKLKGGGFTFEHHGEQITLQTGADVAEWVKDRKKNFPTEKRIMEKAEEAAAKRASELEFLRRLKGKPPRVERKAPPTKPAQIQDKRQNNEKKQGEDNVKREQLAALRKKLHESMMQKNAALANLDLGVGYDSDTESDAESSVLSESSVVSSSDEPSDESDAESEDNEAPEPASSKVAPPAIKIPPPAPVSANVPGKRSDRICDNWARYGKCTWSNKCKFKHPERKEAPRPGLYEVMVEKELVKGDQLALDAIKYLGQHGFLG